MHSLRTSTVVLNKPRLDDPLILMKDSKRWIRDHIHPEVCVIYIKHPHIYVVYIMELLSPVR